MPSDIDFSIGMKETLVFSYKPTATHFDFQYNNPVRTNATTKQLPKTFAGLHAWQLADKGVKYTLGQFENTRFSNL